MKSIFGRLLGRRTAPSNAPSTSPNAVDLYERALAAAVAKDLPLAIALFDQVLAIDPAHADAHYKRGNALKDQGQLDAAVDSYDRAIALRSTYTYAFCNRGVLQHRLNRLDEALASYDQATGLDPNDALTHYNRALLLQDLSRWEDALVSYDRAVALNPRYSEAQYNRALAQLHLGRFDEGWRGFEWRWKHAQRLSIGAVRDFGKPLWLGDEDIAGKRLLLHAEGGLGDTLQFCRYATLCADRGAHVLLEAQAALTDLLRSLRGVARVLPAGDPLPEFDYHAPLMSLPLAFGTTPETVPCSQGYLEADPKLKDAWEARLGPRTQPRIGLAWSGNPGNWIDGRRSVALAEWLQVLPSRFAYFCLQRDVRPADQVILESTRLITKIDDSLLDFPNTAALIKCLDLCISIDSSPAHLSGALGGRHPTWLLLPHNPDWRWLRERHDTPWYSNMRLYRQATAGDWKGVFAQVAVDLRRTFPTA